MWRHYFSCWPRRAHGTGQSGTQSRLKHYRDCVVNCGGSPVEGSIQRFVRKRSGRNTRHLMVHVYSFHCASLDVTIYGNNCINHLVCESVCCLQAALIELIPPELWMIALSDKAGQEQSALPFSAFWVNLMSGCGALITHWQQVTCQLKRGHEAGSPCSQANRLLFQSQLGSFRNLHKVINVYFN